MAKYKFKKLTPYLVVFVVAILLSRLVPSLRNNTADTLEYPLSILSWVNSEIGAAIFFHHNFRENIKLKREILALKQKINAAEEALQENRRLKGLLAFRQDSPLSLLAAKVIARDPDNWSSAIIIDKGKKDGVRPAMVVISEGGLVGKVMESGSTTSKIMLLTDPNLSVSAMLQRSREEGLVSGTLGKLLIMRYLSADIDIKLSDVVITSGLSRIYPKGIIIGRVAEVETQFSGSSHFAMIKPEVNFSSLEEVMVVTGK